VVEPIGDGLGTNLRHPGANITGVTTFDPQQARTQFEFLKAVKPELSRIAILSDLGVSVCLSNSNLDAAQALGLRAQIIRVKGPSPDFYGAFSAMENERADALVVLEEPINAAWRKQIAGLASARRLPTVFAREQADAGGLIAYGTSLRNASKHMAAYADKILKGAKPGDLPIEAALHPELVINLKTARELGLTIPPELLTRANEVIE
jgi:putative ABC transport system substrate-binding protein